MTADSEHSDFFVAGGTLSPRIPSYVERPADEELLQSVLRGDFCYVLTPRQMGKSSLMVRTARKLDRQGVRTAIIDLTQIGSQPEETWYFDLISELARSLRLRVDMEEWWQEHAAMGLPSRFRAFIRDVILEEIESRVVIFVDEIDYTLKLGFSDDFFAAIRSLYNSRSTELDLHRITFVLLGVASPSDLIKDRSRTPFNIGKAILLHDFDLVDTGVLADRLEDKYQGNGKAIFARIYYWTNGHPYLTQRICQTIDGSSEESWTDKKVDLEVEKLFLARDASKESNLEFVRERLLNSDDRRKLLLLYRQVLAGKSVPDDRQSVAQNELKLSGLLKSVDGHLAVRNQIYRTIFNLEWVRVHTAIDWTRVIAAAALLIIFAGAFVLGHNSWVDRQIADAKLNFYQAHTDDERFEYLTKIIAPPRLWETERRDYAVTELFYGLSRHQQERLFAPQYSRHQPENPRKYTDLVRSLYGSFADVEGDGSNTELLDSIVEFLEPLEDQSPVQDLITELNAWREARQLASDSNWTEAVAAYSRALDINPTNPATRYERAVSLASLDSNEAALSDLDILIGMARNLPVVTATPTVIPTAVSFSTADANSTEQISTPAANNSPVPPPRTLDDSDLVRTTPVPTAPLSASPNEPQINLPRESKPFTSRFQTEEDIRRVVRKLFQDHRALALELNSSPSTMYQNLGLSGLRQWAIDLVAPTAVLTNVPTVADVPTSDVIPIPATRNVAPLPLTPNSVTAEDNGNSFVVPLAPSDGSVVFGRTTFEWMTDFVPPAGQSFELVFWKEGQDPLSNSFGLASPLVNNLITIDLSQFSAMSSSLRPGAYRWGILLVETLPYRRISYFGGGWRFVFDGQALVDESTPTSSVSPESGPVVVHIVEPGETLTSISMQYGISLDAIVARNGLPSSVIFSNQRLIIPIGLVTATQTLEPTLNPTALVFAGPTSTPTLLIIGLDRIPTLTRAVVPPTSTRLVLTFTPTPRPTPLPIIPTAAPTGQLDGFESIAWISNNASWGTLTSSTEQVHDGGGAAKLAYTFPGAEAGNSFVVFSRNVPIAGTPSQFSLWVYGNGSNHFLIIWVTDNAGQNYQFSFGRVNHQGWRQMTAQVDPNLAWPNQRLPNKTDNTLPPQYPIRVTGIVLDAHPDGQNVNGTIYLDDLRSE